MKLISLRRTLSLLILIGFSLGCNFFTSFMEPEQLPASPASQAAPVDPTATEASVDPTSEAEPLELTPTVSPADDSGAVSTQQANPDQECQDELCVWTNAFPLGRPIGSQGRQTTDPSIRYGSYQRSLKAAMHGVNLLNSTGTPVLAAAAGKVVFSGTDTGNPLALYPGYYGNVLILEHRLPGWDQPLYTLYAHLSEIWAEEGEIVGAGEKIGSVGSSGDVSGSTLHFEVRYGENDYDAVQNPELWLEALPSETGDLQGALAGRFVDDQGNYPPLDHIVVERLGGPGRPAVDTYYLKTYAEDRLKGAGPWQESFAIADLPPGDYQLSFYYNNNLIQRVVPVESGKLSLLTIQTP